MLGLLGALYQIGSVASIIIVPFFTDRFGRKLPIIIGCVIMIAGAVMQGGGSTLAVFMAGRFLLGFGNSFAQLSSPMLLTEICHPQHRARLTTVYNCLWNVGALFVSWLAFGTDFLFNDWSWRIPALLQAFPSMIQLAFIWFVPESPRFLIANDRAEEALQILGKYHANGNTQHPTVQFEYREIKETLALEMEAKKTSSYLDFFKTKGNRYRLAVLISLGVFSQWSGNAIISNYSSLLYESAGVTGSTQKLGLSAGQTSLALVVSVTMAMFVDKLGRRRTFLASTAGMLVTLAIWTLTSGLYEDHGATGAGNAMIVFIWIFGIFYSLAWSGLLVGYAIEILPYMLRAKGLMIMNFCVQIALTLNTYANPVAFAAFDPHTWKFYLIYTVSPTYMLNSPNSQSLVSFCQLIYQNAVLGRTRTRLCLLRVRRDQGSHTRGVGQGYRRRGCCCCALGPAPSGEGGCDRDARGICLRKGLDLILTIVFSFGSAHVSWGKGGSVHN